MDIDTPISFARSFSDTCLLPFPIVLKELLLKLVKNRVRPYYLYQCDVAQGIGHFRTPVEKGIEIMKNLRGHISGYAVPSYVIDAPGGGGKIPINPDYLLSIDVNQVISPAYGL